MKNTLFIALTLFVFALSVHARGPSVQAVAERLSGTYAGSRQGDCHNLRADILLSSMGGKLSVDRLDVGVDLQIEKLKFGTKRAGEAFLKVSESNYTKQGHWEATVELIAEGARDLRLKVSTIESVHQEFDCGKLKCGRYLRIVDRKKYECRLERI